MAGRRVVYKTPVDLAWRNLLHVEVGEEALGAYDVAPVEGRG
jgi:hypothetical protein